MGVKKKRRDPRRRPTISRIVAVEREDVDLREETADITYRASETYARPTSVRVEVEPHPDSVTE